MTDDLVKRLRDVAGVIIGAQSQNLEEDYWLAREAADRIEKLEAALREIAAHPEPYLYADEMAIIAYNALNAE
jgi:hypothetical protein